MGNSNQTKKNGGVIPTVNDVRVLWTPIACGNCLECRKQKAREWTVRLQEEIKINTIGKFVTLTLSNESYKELNNEVINKTYENINKLHNQKLLTSDQLKQRTKLIRKEKNKQIGYDLDNQIATLAVRRFLERWRKEYKKSTRHWLVTELGHNGTENIHLHGIIFTDNSYDDIEKHWKYGYIYPRKNYCTKKGWTRTKTWVNNQTINYMAKYILKTDKDHPIYKSIILCSAGIGNQYTNSTNAKNNKYNGKETNETYKTREGYKMGMPKYYRNKLYTDEQKEQLWINMLDKQVRYVLGEEISIKDDSELYYNKLKSAQEKNKRLNYGDNIKNWEKRNYEIQRRMMMQRKRLNTG